MLVLVLCAHLKGKEAREGIGARTDTAPDEGEHEGRVFGYLRRDLEFCTDVSVTFCDAAAASGEKTDLGTRSLCAYCQPAAPNGHYLSLRSQLTKTKDDNIDRNNNAMTVHRVPTSALLFLPGPGA